MAEFAKISRIKKIHDLKVYTLAYSLLQFVFKLSLCFPKEESYSLTDQIRRSSRSVAINIREGFAKRRYHHVFVRHLNDALGSSEETRGWLQVALDCGYINKKQFIDLDAQYDSLNGMLYKLMQNWETYNGQS